MSALPIRLSLMKKEIITEKWSEEIGRQKYSEGGRGDAAKIAETIKVVLGFKKNYAVIDYASSFGRVARNIGEFLPESDICAVDIHGKLFLLWKNYD